MRTFKVCSFFSNFAQYILMWRENMNNKNKGQDYDRYDVAEESMLLDWLLRNVKLLWTRVWACCLWLPDTRR